MRVGLRLWVGRRWEPILGYISKFDGKEVSGSNELRGLFPFIVFNYFWTDSYEIYSEDVEL